MKNTHLIVGVLSLSLAACGGHDQPSQTASAPAGQRSVSPAASQDTPPQPTVDPAKKRVARPRIDPKMVQSLFGNETPAPAAEVASTPELVALGERLYHAQALSKLGNMSCASCHDLGNYGVDGKPTSPGSDGSMGERNSPTTYNAFRQFAQFWDYRAASVEQQALMPVLNPIEHGVVDEAELVAKIKSQPELVEGFAVAFAGVDEPVDPRNFGLAIGAFERTLATRSRWDSYLDGDQKALSNEELVGLDTFIKTGCATCHMNRALGGQMAQKFGAVQPYAGADTGRAKVTGNDGDRYMFKVPMLLNVARTAPYYHDGSMATLEEAIEQMGKAQLGKTLTKDEVASIRTFLDALTGELPAKFEKN